MNLWECSHDGCRATAIGIGGAAGLRAIGWHFTPRHSFPWQLLCPAHHPEGADAARAQAARLQVGALAAAG